VSFSLFAASFVLPASGNAVAQTDFKVCESTYALCTSAPCTTVSAKDGTVSCACEVEDRLFRRAGAALPGEGDQRGQELRSRYFPLKNVAVCTNDRPWASCLDKLCLVDKNDPTKATCACTAVKDQGPYVIGAEAYTDKLRITGLISLATVAQITQVTDFLKGTSQFPHRRGFSFGSGLREASIKASSLAFPLVTSSSTPDLISEMA
jgi:hypothetical protein